MRTRALWSGAGWLLSGLLACGDGADQGTAAERRVCASCLHAGSETSDFSGSAPTCYGEPAPAPEGAGWSERLDEVRAVYAGAFEATLGWGQLSPLVVDPARGILRAAPRGYAEATRVSGRIELGEPTFLAGRPNPYLPPDYHAECHDEFRVPATIEFATADGALAGTAQGALNVGAEPSLVRARLDLAEALGTLDLPLAPGREFQGGVDLEFDFYPGAKHGQLRIWLGRGDVGGDVFEAISVLESYFPDDGCGVNGLRSTPEEPVSWLEGQTTAQALESWAAAIAASPIQGSRKYCAAGAVQETSVAVSFELAAPERDGICQQPAWAAGATEGRLRFASPSRLSTSDGLIDTALASGVLTSGALTLSRAPQRAFTLWEPFGSIPAAQFAAASGMLGIDPGANTELLPRAEAQFARREGGVSAEGNVIVVGYTCMSGPDCMGRPLSDTRWPADVQPLYPQCEP